MSEDFRIMGAACTFGGPIEKVVDAWPTRRELEAMMAKGMSRLEADQPRPACPYCGGGVGKITPADLEASLERIAEQRGIPLAALRQMYEWAALQPRCFSSPQDLARAYGAELKRMAKREKRRTA